jgi:hypothetical protein
MTEFRPTCWVNRILVSSIVLTCVASLACITTPWAKHAAARRERTYNTVLQEYKDELKLGSTRTQVEDYLKTKSAAILHTCSPGCDDDPKATAAPDYALLGKGDGPWYCSAELVFVDFEFEAVNSGENGSLLPSDKLKSINIRRAWRDCL